MDLIRLTIRLHDGGRVTRYSTTDQNIGEIEAEYLRNIPGAVFALRCLVEKNISEKRRDRVFRVQAVDRLGAEIRRANDGRSVLA